MNGDHERDHEPVHSFDWNGSIDPSVAVVSAVVETEGTDPAALEPLYDVINPDALDALFAPTSDPHARLEGAVTFHYHGYRVVLGAHGRGHLFERGDGPRTAADAPRDPTFQFRR